MASFFITTTGWFAWVSFLDGVYAAKPSGTYNIRDSFTHLWGRDPLWWATLFIVLGIIGLLEILMKAVKRKLIITGVWKWRPWQKSKDDINAEEWELEVWQELEQDPVLWEKLKKMARDGDDSADVGYDEELDEREKVARSISRGSEEGPRFALFRRLRSFWR
jgi:phospholipid-translocating ATPase